MIRPAAVALLALILPVAAVADPPGPPPPNPPPAPPAHAAKPAPPAPPARPPGHGTKPYPCGNHGSGQSGSSKSGCYNGNQPQVYLDANTVQSLMATPHPVPTHKPTPRPKSGIPAQDVFSTDSSANAAK